MHESGLWVIFFDEFKDNADFVLESVISFEILAVELFGYELLVLYEVDGVLGK